MVSFSRNVDVRGRVRRR